MKKLFLLVMLGIGFLPVGADEFEVASVIHPVVVKLEAPRMIEGFDQGQMAVTTSSDQAALHFAQGMTLLNASWGFEAYRHFCEVVKLDPQCLMAYCGIALALADGRNEFINERNAAVERIADLLVTTKENDEERWNEMEGRFAQAAGFLFTEGMRASGQAFKAAAEKFPANIQARMYSLFLLRDGFDVSGDPRLGQERASEGLRQLLEEHPENISVMSMWVNSQTEAPGRVPILRKDVLPVARRLVELHPEYPPFQLILAHTEARCGNAGRALEAATASRTLFEKYRKDQKVSIYDCEGLVQARLYQVYLNHMAGRGEKALVEAKALASIEVDEARVFSGGAALLMWEGRTIGARLMMAGQTKADFKKGETILATLKDEAWFKEKSNAIYYRDCLGFYLGVRAAIAEGNLDTGQQLFNQLVLRIESFGKGREVASKTSSYSSWLRAWTTLGVMAVELRGLLAEMGEGATKLSAGTWYRAAIDRQERPANLLPPSVAYPMQWRLGSHYLSRGDFEKAASTFGKGLELRPNHLALLTGLREAVLKLGREEEAGTLQEQIKAIRE